MDKKYSYWFIDMFPEKILKHKFVGKFLLIVTEIYNNLYTNIKNTTNYDV